MNCYAVVVCWTDFCKWLWNFLLQSCWISHSVSISCGDTG